MTAFLLDCAIKVSVVFGIALIALRLLRGGSSPIQTGRWFRLAESVARDYGLRKPLRLRRSSRHSILATWGFIKPEVILPADSIEWPVLSLLLHFVIPASFRECGNISPSYPLAILAS